jgi:hypothetical protein
MTIWQFIGALLVVIPFLLVAGATRQTMWRDAIMLSGLTIASACSVVAGLMMLGSGS